MIKSAGAVPHSPTAPAGNATHRPLRVTAPHPRWR